MQFTPEYRADCAQFSKERGLDQPVCDINPDDPDQHSWAFIKLTNWHRFQDWRGTNADDRPRWVKLHASLLTSRDWLMGDNDQRVLMIVLLSLAGQTANRIPNDRAYLMHLCNFNPKDDGDCARYHELFCRLMGNCYFDLTLDGSPEVERKDTKTKKAAPTRSTKHFAEFWNLYPRKAKKAYAEKRWAALGCDDNATAIIANVKARLQNEWRDKDHKYILHASTFLNQEVWKDDIEEVRSDEDWGDVGRLEPGQYK